MMRFLVDCLQSQMSLYEVSNEGRIFIMQSDTERLNEQYCSSWYLGYMLLSITIKDISMSQLLQSRVTRYVCRPSWD